MPEPFQISHRVSEMFQKYCILKFENEVIDPHSLFQIECSEFSCLGVLSGSCLIDFLKIY